MRDAAQNNENIFDFEHFVEYLKKYILFNCARTSCLLRKYSLSHCLMKISSWEHWRYEQQIK